MGLIRNTHHKRRQLISLPDQWAADADLVDVDRNVRVGLCFDQKRQPKPASTDTATGLAYLDTDPWPTADDAIRARKAFDQWRSQNRSVLKTVSDWQCFNKFRSQPTFPAKRTTAGRPVKGPGDIAITDSLIQRLRHDLAHGLQGLPPPAPPRSVKGWTASAMANALTELGVPTTKEQIKNAKRRQRHAFPKGLTVGDKALIERIKTRFPNWQIHP